jgi:anthranilate phosphoribosyltransferase
MVEVGKELVAFTARLLRREDLSRTEAVVLLDALLDPVATDAQIAGTLVALAAKGASVEELTGLASAMRERATPIHSQHTCFIDTAGTGSSRTKTFNIGTAAAFVIAGAGLPVAKHGSRAATSKCGSADVLTELGVNISADPAVSERCLNEIGICFMFAPLYHGATARVAAVRRELGLHTVFNLLGPLTNPARAPRQVIGVFDAALTEPMARALLGLGTERAWVVHGTDGLDEITVTGPTAVSEVRDGTVRTFQVSPGDFGLEPESLDHLRGGDIVANAAIIRQVLSGERRDAARSLVVLNAAAALFVGGKAVRLPDAAALAATSIDNRSAWGKLEQLVNATTAIIVPE